MQLFRKEKAFTLIELLVVIAIIAILTVVVILTLNPAELLRQARDSNRVADMATVSNALNVYITDQGSASSFSLGIASNTDLSIPDPNGSSTCGNLGLPSFTASSGQAWQCSSATSSRLVNGNGWIPVNLNQISSGAPIGSLPQDPTNQTSSGLFYSYNTNSSQFEVTANLESSKYKSQYAVSPQTNNFPEVISGGTPTVSALYNPSGLVGYWNLDEGSGSSTKDLSGNGNGGTWNGTAIGTNGTYYTGGKVGNYSGDFDGSTDYMSVPNGNFLNANQFTISEWLNAPATSTTFYDGGVISKYVYNTSGIGVSVGTSGSAASIDYVVVRGGTTGTPAGSLGFSANVNAPFNAWNLFTLVVAYNGVSTTISVYVNGAFTSQQALGLGTFVSNSNVLGIGNGYTGQGQYFNGLIDDVRIYNRALSAAEIQALYLAEK